MKLLFENWRKYLEEDKEKPLKILMPPTDLKAARALIVKHTDTDPDGKMVFSTGEGEKEKRGTPEEWVKTLPNNILPHEALHAIQTQEMPELFKGSSDILPDGWNKATDKQKKDYFSVPAEIMAFAYDYATKTTSADTSPEETYGEYEKIGGKVFEKFKRYVEEYKKRLKKDEDSK